MKDFRLVWSSGFIAVAVYLICATLAFFQYPLRYSPLDNWLSDLGNPLMNPTGASFYNLGCILVGLFLIVFCLGLQIWNDGKKRRIILLSITQVTGILSSLSLIASAFFPLGANTPIHSIAGKLHIIFAGFFLSFSATILLRYPRASKWIAFFGLLTALVNFIYGLFLHEVFIAEWAAIGMFIVYVLMIAGNTFIVSSSHGASRTIGSL